LIASGSISTDYVYIWNMLTGNVIQTLAHKKVRSLLLMNNQYLISGDKDGDGDAVLWNASSFNNIKQITHSAINIKRIDTNNIVFIRWDQQIDTWDIRTSSFNDLSSSSDNYYSHDVIDIIIIAAGRTNNQIEIWDFTTRTKMRTITSAHSNDKTQLASSSLDGAIKLWNLNTFSLIKTLTDGQRIDCIEYINDTLIASGSISTDYVYIWNMLTGNVIQTLAHKKVRSLLLMNSKFKKRNYN